MKRHDLRDYMTVRWTPADLFANQGIRPEGGNPVSAETLDTQRALQLLGEIQKARRDLAAAEGERKQLGTRFNEADRRVNAARDRLNAIHAQFDALTNPEGQAHPPEAEPVPDAEAEATTRRRRSKTPEEMTSNQ